MKKVLVLIYLLSVFNLMEAQIREGKYHSREVIIQVGDTIIKTYILTGDVHKKPIPNKEFFWYSKGMINSNVGGYAGKLLHGAYEAFLNNKLLESGQFVRGYKSGLWKTWYLNGKLKKNCLWKDGALSGRAYFYNDEGILVRKCYYKNGEYHSKNKDSDDNKTKKKISFKNWKIKSTPVNLNDDKTSQKVKSKKTKEEHNENKK